MESTNKKSQAKQLGISRSSLYYRSKMKVRDEELREQILTILQEHSSYGHRRIALVLKRNKKAILRVMKKYGIKPYLRRCRKYLKKGDLKKDPLSIPNYAKLLCPIQRNVL
jgi:putative transposase